MKKLHVKNLAAILLVMLSDVLIADPPEPPNPGGNPGGGGVPVGAPVDDGLIVLLIMGVLFGIYQFYVHWRKIEKPENVNIH